MKIEKYIERPNWVKSLFCKHDFAIEIYEGRVSDLPDDKFVIQYDTCKKCCIVFQETLMRPKPRTIKLTTKMEL
jgi:hypothetical protein